MNDIDISIILINYNNAKLTYDAVNSIIDKSSGFKYEIIVVDNSCNCIEFDKLKELIGNKADLIKSESNLGFGKGNNLGVSKSRGKYVYFINNDTLLINNAIYELYKFLEKNSNVGIVGSNLFGFDNQPGHSFVYDKFDLIYVKKCTSIKILFKKTILKKRNDFNYYNHPIKIKGCVVGASLMMSRTDFDTLHGYDEDIFMFAEEALLCYRLINELHKEIYNIPTSKIIHLEGTSIKGQNKIISPKMAYEFANGNYIYFKKAFGETDAKKLLKIKIKEYKKKIFISKIVNRNIVQKYINLYNGFKNKYEEVIK